MKIHHHIAALTVIAVFHPAHAEPAGKRQPALMTAPTAWISRGALEANARIDQRGDWAVGASVGLGGIASVGIVGDHDLRACIDCSSAGSPVPIRTISAVFRMGARENQWFDGQPALAIGVRVMMSHPTYPLGLRTADIYAIASRDVGTTSLHAGIIGQDAETVDGDHIRQRLANSRWPQLRPVAGVQWHPSIYPRTTLMADLSWIAEIRSTGPKQTWVAGWGVQFRAYPRTTLALMVRHRQDEGLASSTVLIGARFGLDN